MSAFLISSCTPIGTCRGCASDHALIVSRQSTKALHVLFSSMPSTEKVPAGATLETGHQFLGSLFGDHAKTAIGMLFDAGSVIGAGASVFDEIRAPKYVAPFAWG